MRMSRMMGFPPKTSARMVILFNNGSSVMTAPLPVYTPGVEGASPRVEPHRSRDVSSTALNRQRYRPSAGAWDRLPVPSVRTPRRELVVVLVDERSRRPAGAVGQAADRRARHDAHGLFQ